MKRLALAPICVGVVLVDATVRAAEPTATTTPQSAAAPIAAAEPERTKPQLNEDAIPQIRGAQRPNQRRGIGLDPSAPQSTALPGGVTPAFGQASQSTGDWVFDLHGMLQLPLRVGINERVDPGPGQKKTVLHTPPVVPGDLETFEYSAISPDPWAQLNFSYGNRDVTATVIVAARTVSNANGYFNPADQLGINDAFVTFHPPPTGNAAWSVHVGAFANRYGIMGEYDMGRYGTPLIARLSGVGATGTGQFELGKLTATAELGVMGQLNKSPVGVEPAGWNGFTDPNAGTSFAGHAHLSLAMHRRMQLGLHGIRTFAQDDRATTTTQKDGSISVVGADAHLSMRRFGHLYVGYAHTLARTARSVSGVIRVLNASGGLGLMEEYFGLDSEGSGDLDTFGAQYDFSLGNALRHPRTFRGNAPDLVASIFGIGTAVSSPVPVRNGVFKIKYGGALTYSFASFAAAGVRFDQVHVDVADASQTHAILSPRLIFKSGWNSRDQVMLQYSRYFYGQNSVARVGYPPARDPSVIPDADVVTLMASIWF